MVPKDFRKPQCVTAGWVTLLVAVVWEVASIYSIGVFNCAWDFFGVHNGISTWNMLYVTYFMGGCKSESDALSIGFVLTPSTSPADNLQIWMWIFTAVTLAWIPSCVTLIVAASSVVRGKVGAMLYYPWLSVTSILVVLDLAGSVYHFVDVFSTTTADDYASFTYNTNWSNLTQSSSSEGITTWLPSLYVTLFFWRFLVLWLLNLYFVYVVYKASSAVAVYNTKHLQPTTLMTAEKSKTWRDRFFKGPDPRELPHQSMSTVFMPPLDENKDLRLETQERSPPAFIPSNETQQAKGLSESSLSSSESTLDHYPVRYEEDEFGIPIKELRGRDPREISYNPSEGHLPRSPLPSTSTSQVFVYPEQPRSRPQSYGERWQESAPPLAGGVEVPPELNKNRPFSYMAGDQPQFMRKPLSRSNSRSEYPVIPRPDYTVAQRQRHSSSGSLEYVPNRFKVPSPTRPLQSTSSFIYDGPSTSSHSPTSPRRASVPPKKPHFFPKVSKPPSEDISTLPQAKYIPQQDIPSQQQTYNTSKPLQSTNSFNSNINNLY